MEVHHSILFTRPLARGEGAAVQEEEMNRVAMADAAKYSNETKRMKLISTSVISETNGALKFVATYFKCDCPEGPEVKVFAGEESNSSDSKKYEPEETADAEDTSDEDSDGERS